MLFLPSSTLHSRRGFTLIELLLVVIVIGIIAALVLTKISGVKEQAYEDAMMSDLRNLALAQEIQLHDTDAYAADLASVDGFAFSPDVIGVSYDVTGNEEWAAIFGHEKTETACLMVRSNASNQTMECAEPSTFVLDVSDPSPAAGATVTFTADGPIALAMLPEGLIGRPLLAADPADVESLKWNFGDGTVTSGDYATVGSIEHTFAEAGTAYGVILTITLIGGEQAFAFRTVTTLDDGAPAAPANQAPTASFTFSPESPEEGQTVQFNAVASADPDGTISSYSWDFGDGQTGTGMSPSLSFSAAGTYTVTLTVTDNEGLAATGGQSIQVDAPAGITLLTLASEPFDTNWTRFYSAEREPTAFAPGTDSGVTFSLAQSGRHEGADIWPVTQVTLSDTYTTYTLNGVTSTGGSYTASFRLKARSVDDVGETINLVLRMRYDSVVIFIGTFGVNGIPENLGGATMRGWIDFESVTLTWTPPPA